MKLKPLLIIAILALFFVLSIVIFSLAEEIYKIYRGFEALLSYYIFILIIISLLTVFVFSGASFRMAANLIIGDKFFLVFAVIIFLIALAMIFHQPTLLRPDKEIAAIEAARDFNLRYFSDLGEGFGGRAKFLFFALHYFSLLIPLTIKSLAIVNSFLILFQAILIYLILKLLTSDSRIYFVAGLLFILYPNNLLLGTSPEYAVLAQTLILGSIFCLLLFTEYKDRKILILSLAILTLALLSRLEIIIFLPVYFFILFRALPADSIRKILAPIILFLILIMPVVFQILLGYATGSLIMAVHPVLPSIFADQETSISQKIVFHYYPREIAVPSGNIIKDYVENIKNLLEFNFLYLIKFVPLFYFLIFGLFFLFKNKHFQFFFVYFAAVFLSISLFAYKDRIIVPQYLSYIFTPLVVIAGLFLKKIIDFTPRFVFLLFAAGLIIFNFISFQTAYQRFSGEGGSDDFIDGWNQEYRFIQPYKRFIGENSVIIADQLSLWGGIVAAKNIKTVRAEEDLVLQVKQLIKQYNNVFITQGLLSSRGGFNFKPQDWQKIIDDKFYYQVIYEKNIWGNFPVFLYKIENIK